MYDGAKKRIIDALETAYRSGERARPPRSRTTDVAKTMLEDDLFLADQTYNHGITLTTSRRDPRQAFKNRMHRSITMGKRWHALVARFGRGIILLMGRNATNRL